MYNNTSKTGVAGISIIKSSNTPDEYITGVNILSGTIRNNTTESGNGGGFKISGTLPVTLGQPGSNLAVYANEAASGGAFHISNGANVKIYDCVVGGTSGANKAKNGNGGGMFVDGGNVEINGGDLLNNQALGSSTLGKGGGLYVSNGNVTLNSGEISGNTSQNNGGGICIDGGGFSVVGGTINDNTSDANGGGVYVDVGSSTTPVSIENCEIAGNTAHVSGGGVYAAKGNVTIANATVGKAGSANTAQTGDGGAMYIVSGNLEITDSQVTNNEATAQDGGAFYVGNGTVTLNGVNSIVSNQAGRNGGGVYLNNGSFTLKKSGTSGEMSDISGNTAHVSGGGIYVAKGDVTIANATIGKIGAANTAQTGSGGAMYVASGNLDITNAQINNNAAMVQDGGAFYVGNGTVTLNGEIGFSSNSAGGNGGAMCLSGGSLTLSANSSFIGNSAKNGAGVYVGGGNLTMLGGTMENNTATGNGGGAYVSVGTVTFNSNLKNNTAANGGGLYLASGATMTYTGGIVTGNKAEASESATATTAYHGGNGIEGCGGGIYLQSSSSSKKTTLCFDFSGSSDKKFGLFGNTADKAGAEIVSEGGNTQVQLPAISEMQLVGFEGQDASPYWYQDYFTGDTGYDKTGGHAVAGNVTTVDRFKNIMKLVGTQYLEHRIPETRLPQIVSNYLCVTMSFSMLNITLKATGLLGHETALFKLIRHGTDKNTVYDVLLRADKGASETLRNMPWGTYSVIPNNEWHREYDPVEPRENVRIGESDNYVFEYKMHHKNAAAMPQHDERQIQGKSVPSSTVEGGKPEKYNGSEL